MDPEYLTTPGSVNAEILALAQLLVRTMLRVGEVTTMPAEICDARAVALVARCRHDHAAFEARRTDLTSINPVEVPEGMTGAEWRALALKNLQELLVHLQSQIALLRADCPHGHEEDLADSRREADRADADSEE